MLSLLPSMVGWRTKRCCSLHRLRYASPAFTGRLLIAEPQPGPLWPEDPRIRLSGIRDGLDDLGAEILPFENRHFGASYPTR